MMSLNQQILGGLYGLAIGDAWAAPALSRPAETRRAYDGWIDHLMPAPGGKPAGTITEAAGFALGAIAHFCENRRHVDLKSTPVELLPLAIAPLGLFYPGKGAAARRLCEASARPVEAAAGGAAMAAAWAAAMTAECRLDEIISAGLAAAEPPTTGVLSRAVDLARRRIEPFRIITELYAELTGLPAGVDTAAGALAIFAMAHGHPLQAAIYAAALSWQAHAVGALSCGIAGSWCGDNIFSESQKQMVEKANPQVDLRELARRLAEQINEGF